MFAGMVVLAAASFVFVLKESPPDWLGVGRLCANPIWRKESGMYKSRRTLVTIGVLLFAALTVNIAFAQDTGYDYYACVNNASGTIHMAAPGEECQNNEVLIQWNSEGPPGPPGDQGPPGDPGPYTFPPPDYDSGVVLFPSPPDTQLIELFAISDANDLFVDVQCVRSTSSSGSIYRGGDYPDGGLWYDLIDFNWARIRNMAIRQGSDYPCEGARVRVWDID